MDYQDFLRTKGRKAVECGFEWEGTNRQAVANCKSVTEQEQQTMFDLLT